MFYLGLTIGAVLGFFVCAIMVLSSRPGVVSTGTALTKPLPYEGGQRLDYL